MLRLYRLVLLLLLAACAGPREINTFQRETQLGTSVPAAGETPAAVAASEDAPTASPTALPPGTFINPVLDADFLDPSVLKVGDAYYAYATNTTGANIPVARSVDLVHWELLGEALPILPDWALQATEWTWAPDVAGPFESGDYLMYFTTRFRIGSNGTQCIGVATSKSPEGPFSPIGDKPLICFISAVGALDADRFVDSDGTSYLLWKSDGIGDVWKSGIYIQELSKDGRRLVGEPTWLMTYDLRLRWEGNVVESPVLWKYADNYYLFYSANNANQQQYSVGVAVADSPLGPYQKLEVPILKTDLKAGIVGPGGQELVTTPSGETWMLFHSWAPRGYRRLNIAKLEWVDGWPRVTEVSRAPVKAPVIEAP